MFIGDKEACPKGGRPEYRNGPWYQQVMGKKQGDRMKQSSAKACGWGSHAELATRYTTIEQKVSALRTWYDVALKDRKRKRSTVNVNGRSKVNEHEKHTHVVTNTQTCTQTYMPMFSRCASECE